MVYYHLCGTLRVNMSKPLGFPQIFPKKHQSGRPGWSASGDGRPPGSGDGRPAGAPVAARDAAAAELERAEATAEAAEKGTQRVKPKPLSP